MGNFEMSAFDYGNIGNGEIADGSYSAMLSANDTANVSVFYGMVTALNGIALSKRGAFVALSKTFPMFVYPPPVLPRAFLCSSRALIGAKQDSRISRSPTAARFALTAHPTQYSYLADSMRASTLLAHKKGVDLLLLCYTRLSRFKRSAQVSEKLTVDRAESKKSLPRGC